MTRRYDVVIIGAGVVGASVAWHLARRGVNRILVIDRGAPLSGSTARATGGFRAQFGSAINVRLSLLSREKLERFEAEVGADPGYEKAGYLFVASSEDDLRALRAAASVQRSAGFDETVELGHEDVRRVNPHLNPASYIGGTFSPADGFIRPLQIGRGYLDGARGLGVEVREGVASMLLETDAGRITRIQLSDGSSIHANTVVNAGGAWASAVVRSAGVNLPVAPLRRQVASTVPSELLPGSMPMTIYCDGYHLRVRDGRVLLLWPDDPADPTSSDFDDRWLAPIERMTRERVPLIADVPIDRAACWAGLYEVSPDRHVILGRAVELENLYLANGSSGHGVMHAPTLGQLLAEMITVGVATSIDTRELRPSRFAEDDPIGGSSLL